MLERFLLMGRREGYHKQEGRRKFYASLIKLPRCKSVVEKPVWLELELHAQTDSRRELEDRAGTPERVRNRRDSRSAAVDQEGVILPDSALVVQNVEPIHLEAELFTFTDCDRVIGAEVQIVSRRRAGAAGER